MKLQPVFDYVVGKIKERTTESDVLTHANAVKSECKSLRTRVVWDVCRFSVGVNTICEWYDKYECNDTHINTLFNAAFKEVYPAIYSSFNS